MKNSLIGGVAAGREGGAGMSGGRKRETRAATFRISPEVLDALDAYCESHGVLKSFVAEQGIRAYLEAKAGAEPAAGRNEAEAAG